MAKSDIVVLGSLAVLACMDILRRYVPCYLVGILVVASAAVGGLAKRSVADYVGVLLLGGAFLVLSIWSEEAIGLGDAWGILAVLLAKGFFEGLAAVLLAFLFAALLSAGLLTVGKIKGRRGCGQHRIPFLPCLLAGYILGSF